MRFLSNVAASTLGALVALGLLFLLFFFFIFAIALSTDSSAPSVTDGAVLRMELSGPIPESASDDPFARAFLGERSYDLRDVTGALEKAAADERVRGVWLELEGVGGPWATLQEVRRALERFRSQSGKPILASAADFGMSEKDYFLATTADSIFTAPEAPFEFNGFYTSVAFYEGTLDKLGVEPQIVRAGTYKSAVEPFLRDDLSAPNREQLSEILATQSNQFLQAVSQSRRRDTSALQQMSSEGAILTAQHALDAGLIDGILHRDEVQSAWRSRLGLEEDAEVEDVSLGDYAKVPNSEAGLETGGDGRIAIVYANGQIVSGESDGGFAFRSGPEQIGSETFAEAMRSAREDEGIDAVVLRINSPGGSVSASEAMRHQAELTAQEKPLIVSMGDYAASGGYWIATAADTLVADPTTLTGSIGVFSVLFNANQFFNDKLGVTFDAVRTSPVADLYSGVRPLSQRERQLLESSIESTYQSFLQKVAKSRGLTVAEVDSIAQGRVWTGADAQRVGLVDTLGTLDDAIGMVARSAGLAQGDYRVTTYPRQKPFFERFMSGASAQAARAWTSATTSAPERAFVQQRAFLRRLARQHGEAQARLPFDLTIE
jgi:protease-4